MAKMTNSLVGGKNFRSNEMFTNRSMTAGYAYHKGNHAELTSGMSLNFAGSEAGDRTYNVVIGPEEVGRVVDRLLNADYNMGFFASSVYAPKDRSDYHYEDLLLEHGIKMDTYRYPAGKAFVGAQERWFWVRAVNRYHAEHQFARVIKSYKPSLVELYDEAD